MTEHYREVKRRREAGEEVGFTLIELLIVIVVLGILAATVIFALGGITGSSAQAACNTDAKSVETAVAAYKGSPDNTTNTFPVSVGDLTSGGTNSLAGTGGKDSFLQVVPNNTHYKIQLTTNGVVQVAPVNNGTVGTYSNYDQPPTPNPCKGVS